jgi:CheY-like chemotaxis protein
VLDQRRALIIDDNATACQVLQQVLSAWGMIPTLAASGLEALSLVRNQVRFDVVIIDMQMPGMPGLTLAKELRKLVAELPIVMTSSLGVPMYAAGDNRYLYDLPVVVTPTPGASDQHEAVRQLGVKSIVFKPVKPSLLRAALLEHLDTSKASSAGGAHDEPRKASEGIDAEMGRRHPLRILLAEDNFTNQKVALRMLKRLGYEADVAVNGPEVIKMLNLQTYDVILMDVQMPEMDGLEATRQIRAELEPSIQPYIIAMTAAAMQLDREKCLEAGMDDFLAKPARLEDLAQALRRYLPLSASAS